MVQKLRKRMKDQKGFTLIELLAVIVILGILAAIAVPSVLGIIDNTKKDAFVADAQQMVSSAKMAVANNSDAQPAAGSSLVLSLNYLSSGGYLDQFNDPDGGSISPDSETTPVSTAKASTDGVSSYVVVKNSNGTFSYTVTLKGSKRQISSADGSSITRSDVTAIQ